METETIALEELKLVQSIIHNQEQMRIKVVGWCIATISAISVAYLSQKLNLPPKSYFSLSLIIILIFLWLDTVHRVAVDRAILRSGEIESFFRKEIEYDGPKIGKSISVKNGIPYQFRSLKNVRVYGPYLALCFAVSCMYLVKNL